MTPWRTELAALFAGEAMEDQKREPPGGDDAMLEADTILSGSTPRLTVVNKKRAKRRAKI